MKKFIKTIIVILLIGIMLISSYFLYKNYKEEKEQEKIFKELINIVEDETSEDNEETERININQLYSINNDIVGWLKIDDTNINYPIMQTKKNPNYYLRRNFYKKYSYYGTPYLAENCDVKTSNNLIVYGHHINNSKMFGELEKYQNREFYEEHKNIQLYTLEEKLEYEIIAVFKTVAYTGFKYYNFINTSNEEEFNTFVNQCKELSFYNIENTAVYGDKLLTLSTCEYSRQNGRLVVVAKQINNKEQEASKDIENIKESIVTDNMNKSENNLNVEKQEEKIQTEEKENLQTYTNVASTYDETAFINGNLINYPEFASNYATLIIGKIGVNAPIYLGATDELLLKGAVHDTSSYFCGENGSIVMCGHNYMNNFKRFRRVNQWRYY